MMDMLLALLNALVLTALVAIPIVQVAENYPAPCCPRESAGVRLVVVGVALYAIHTVQNPVTVTAFGGYAVALWGIGAVLIHQHTKE